MLFVVLLHMAAAIIAPPLVRRFGRNAFFPLALVPGAAVAHAAQHTGTILDGGAVDEVTPWIGALGLDLAFRYDAISWIMTMIVSGIGVLIFVYCTRYFKNSEPGLGRFAGVLMAFSGSMLGLVLTDDIMMLYTFWELTTVFSYLLIGHYYDKRSARRSAMHALIATTAGGLAMFLGLLMIGFAIGSTRISEIIAAPEWAEWGASGVPIQISVAAVLLVAGAMTKSALVPFHFWLPAAMAAPTPVSAYLHAATMVKAGIYLLLRFTPALAEVPVWTLSAWILGGLTMLIGAYRALRQVDLKLVLAYGTVSQLGFLAVVVGTGTHAAAVGGTALLISHALFKSVLFMIVGIVDKSAGTRDLRQLSGLGRQMPVVAGLAIVSAASMAAVPPLFGFVAKESVYYAMFHGEWPSQLVLVVLVVGSMLTVAYSARFVWGAFWPKRSGIHGHLDPSPLRAVPPLSWIPSALLTVPTVALPFALGPLDRLLAQVAAPYDPGEYPGHVVLWAGVNGPLLLSLLTLAGGVLLVWRAEPLYRRQQRISPQQSAKGSWFDAQRIYRAVMRGVDDIALQVTAWSQRGSLPQTVGVILGVLGIGVGLVVLLNGPFALDYVLFHNPLEVIIGVTVVAAAFFAVRSRRRLRAVFLISVTGYGVALLFLISGGLDVALTALLVETISLIIFALVLRRLPLHFSRRPFRGDQWGRWAVAIGAAAVVCAVVLIAGASRVAPPTGPEMIEPAYEIAHGANTVNVTLVDLRAWDTMGEISVVLVAATGVASLVFVSRRDAALPRSRDVKKTAGTVWRTPGAARAAYGNNVIDTERDVRENASSNRWNLWLSGGSTLAPERRMVILEVVTRLLFPLVMVFAVYLLFAGHNLPGGGFAAGLTGGLGLVLRYLAGGRFELAEAAPFQAGSLLGSGLFIAIASALLPVLAGGTVLQSFVIEVMLPVWGEVTVVTSIFFDLGVALIVMGLVLDVLRSLGVEVDRHIEADAESTNTGLLEAVEDE